METLKIQIPHGFKIGKFDETTGEVSFIPLPKDIKERIKTFSDVLKYHGITPERFEKQVADLYDDEKAYIQVKYIVSALNEGWMPNWEDSNEWKYYPYFDMDDASSSSSGRFSFILSVDRDSASSCGSRLCFKSRELSDYAGKQFLDIYKELFIIK